MAIVLAHRGANRLARENTVEAFAAAARLGADGVELDVRSTADGMLAVLHDAEVEGLGPLAQLPAAGLPSWLPSLDEALDACAGMQLANVEIKADGVDDPVGLAVAVARALRPRTSPRLLVSSFSLEVIDAHRAVAPELATGWLSVVPMSDDEAVATVAGRGHAALHPHEGLVTRELVAAAHRRGVLVAAWTVNDPARARVLAGMGVDVVITDAPDIILTALAHLPARRADEEA